MQTVKVVPLLQELIRRPVHTEVLLLLKEVLEDLAFKVELMELSGITNLYAIRRVSTEMSSTPILGFLGHADVVPANIGWSVPPFEGLVREEAIWGRGAVDMKGAIACFCTAVAQLLAEFAPLPHLEILISGDEEGSAVYGTPAVLKTLKAQGRALNWDFSLVGEPTAHKNLGDFIKIGSRGSLNVTVTARGVSGHVAYPDFCINPVPVLMNFLRKVDRMFQEGSSIQENSLFEATQMQITKIDVGGEAPNVVPEVAEARFNIRFAPTTTSDAIVSKIRAIAKKSKTQEEKDIRLSLDFDKAGEPVLSSHSPVHALLSHGVSLVTGALPRETALGATSDARFLPSSLPFAEFGLRVQEAHQGDEKVPLKELDTLVEIYKKFIRLFAQSRAVESTKVQMNCIERSENR